MIKETVLNYISIYHESIAVNTHIPEENKSVIIPYQCKSTYERWLLMYIKD